MHMVALDTVWYTFVKTHKAPQMSRQWRPASDKLWSVADLAGMIDATMPKARKPSPPKKQVMG
jgi:hypothetical protein